MIKKLIKKHSDWEFIYIGANIDSYSEGESIGIRKSNIANYKKDGKGILKMFKAAFLASDEFFEEDCIDSSWKDELEDYLEENKNEEVDDKF